jgi:hypothetical protein
MPQYSANRISLLEDGELAAVDEGIYTDLSTLVLKTLRARNICGRVRQRLCLAAVKKIALKVWNLFF